jgi:hypothetical protein
VLADPALASELCHAGRARALAFSWEASARAHRALYQELGGV